MKISKKLFDQTVDQLIFDWKLTTMRLVEYFQNHEMKLPDSLCELYKLPVGQSHDLDDYLTKLIDDTFDDDPQINKLLSENKITEIEVLQKKAEAWEIIHNTVDKEYQTILKDKIKVEVEVKFI